MNGYRSPLKKQQDHAAIARLLLEGHTQKAIAAKLGLSPQCICKDVKEMKVALRDTMLDDLATHKARELARLNEVERLLWEAWEVSRRDGKQTTRQWAVPGVPTADDPNPKPVPTRASFVTENQHGDPRYMRLILDISEQRCRLLGLYEPLKMVAPIRDEDDPSKMTLNERKQRALDMLLAVRVDKSDGR